MLGSKHFKYIYLLVIPFAKVTNGHFRLVVRYKALNLNFLTHRKQNNRDKVCLLVLTFEHLEIVNLIQKMYQLNHCNIRLQKVCHPTYL